MNTGKFNLINRITAFVVFAVSAFVYLSTMEPTASFWDCGEFIASSYKLEVGHPPGNPVFQLIARAFTFFGDEQSAAVLINAMSALCSALTIMFLYLTIVHLGRRLNEKKYGTAADGKSPQAWSASRLASVIGSGVVGAMIYCFSDTFWFSAVEAEVYAMSSLFTAVVFWAMLKWEEQADTEYADRWIVLISLLMGLSIGVHLLNLLTIPALVFIYYYRKYEPTMKKSILVFLLSCVILAVILYGIIPYLPKIAAWFDLLFVNVFGLGFNSGAATFMVLLLALCLWLIFWSYKHEKTLLNTISLCFTMIVIGYSVFAVIIIRSSANTPTNENQPDNPFALVSYIGREQYGSAPLVYGPGFDSPYDLTAHDYYTKLGDKYYKAQGPIEAEYRSEGKMLFPRMWGSDDNSKAFYQLYTNGKTKKIPGGGTMPYFSDNLAFFFDYQINWMYMRYFMWNFVGRQNDLQGYFPGDPYLGNWESGIGFIDKARLGDQSEGPDYLVNSESKNHYYFLPLILGLIGLFYQLSNDKRNWWIVLLLFLLTGLAIVVYLNQTPYQARERDYAYAGSFYAFAIWTGLAVMAIYNFLRDELKSAKFMNTVAAAVVISVICLAVPVQMACQNWDDHDRSGRYTSRDMAENYLQSCGPNAILITHGDNDTFPLWYIQEVEGVRTDVRVYNTSLGQTDWYIDQMKCKQYDSDPLPISLDRKDYLMGMNDFVQIIPNLSQRASVKQVMELFKNPKLGYDTEFGVQKFFPTRKMYIPVNAENALKCGLVSEEELDSVPEYIEINIPEGKNNLTKVELVILDILANYDWSRPICMVQMGGDVNIGLKDYLRYDGFVYTFVPLKGPMSLADAGRTDTDLMYDRLMRGYKLESLAADGIHIDYQNLTTFNGVMSIRNIFTQTARKMFEEGDSARTEELLDRMQQVMRQDYFPLNSSLIPSYNTAAVFDAIELYYKCGAREKADKLAMEMNDEIMDSISLFMKSESASAYNALTDNLYILSYLYNVVKAYGSEELTELVKGELDALRV